MTEHCKHCDAELYGDWVSCPDGEFCDFQHALIWQQAQTISQLKQAAIEDGLFIEATQSELRKSEAGKAELVEHLEKEQWFESKMGSICRYCHRTRLRVSEQGHSDNCIMNKIAKHSKQGGEG